MYILITDGLENLLIETVTALNMVTKVIWDHWWLDLGATLHVCNNCDFFKSYEDVVGGQVLIVNGNLAKVLGVKIIDCHFTSPSVCSLCSGSQEIILVYVSLLCKSYFKIDLESNKVVILDRDMYVAKGYCINDMFKISISKVIDSAFIVGSCNVWHAILSNLHFNSMKYMHKIG